MEFLTSLLENASKIESLAKVAGIVAAGLWVWFKFNVLLEKQKARLDAAALVLGQEKAKLEAEQLVLANDKAKGDLQKFARLEIVMTPTYLGEVDAIHLVKATLQVSNTGNRSAYMSLDRSADGKTDETVLTVSKLSVPASAESKAAFASTVVGTHHIEGASIECHPGQTFVTIAVPLQDAGVYKLRLTAVVPKRDLVPELSDSAESATYSVEDVIVVPPVRPSNQGSTPARNRL